MNLSKVRSGHFGCLLLLAALVTTPTATEACNQSTEELTIHPSGNTIMEPWSVILGGKGNTVLGTHSSILGGTQNVVFQQFGTVLGGVKNTVRGQSGAVFGSTNSVSSGLSSTVISGNGSTASGQHAFAVGPEAHAEHDFSAVFNLVDGATCDSHGHGTLNICVDEESDPALQSIYINNRSLYDTIADATQALNVRSNC